MVSLRLWAPPKCKFFAWLVVQDRIWTADRLSSREWLHNPVCALCRRMPKTGNHLFCEFRFTKHIWTEISTWITVPALHPVNWDHATSVHNWWSTRASTPRIPGKGLRSLIILICWELWKERNARIFYRLESQQESRMGYCHGCKGERNS